MDVDSMLAGLGQYRGRVEKRLEELEREDFVARLWKRDGRLWRDDPVEGAAVGNWLGWLDAPAIMKRNPEEISLFVDEVMEAGFTCVVHMGMGGSSLAPMVFTRAFTPARKGLPLIVLDTTDPATVLGIRQRIHLEKTLFIVASKSGTTAEPQAFGDYFFTEVSAAKGELAGSNFVAITDPGSALADEARERGYRRVFLNFKNVGGRYSALTYFGLVPAALMGIDMGQLLGAATRMLGECGPLVRASANPAVALGVLMGEMALAGRDKLTFVIPQTLAMLDAWLEQLIAESTGKEGKGILPVAGEPLGPPEVYGDDRLFVRIACKGGQDSRTDHSLALLKRAGQPVIAIDMENVFDVAGQFLLWEVATATAGSIMGINPFDQPNVQESKDNTNRILASVREMGALPEQEPALFEEGLEFYTDERVTNARDAINTFLSLAGQEDYVAFQAYLPDTPETIMGLQRLRTLVRDRLRRATTVGFGPRYLHSTGQLHKGGPNRGLFIQLTADDVLDTPIPGQPYTFGTFKKAQALGDLEALKKHGRRVMRVHLGADIQGGIDKLLRFVDEAFPRP